MELHNLRPTTGSTKKRKRVARGEGSKRGGTATRGHNGAKSRSGYSKKIGFEGGQMPIQRRIPKFGFKNYNRKPFTAINLDRLQEIVDKFQLSKVDKAILVEKGILSKNARLKILGNGELTSSIEIVAEKFSKSAEEKIKKVGGNIVNE